MSNRINPRKIVIKDIIKKNNISKDILLNKNNKINNINSIELSTPRNENLNIKINNIYLDSHNSKNRISKSNIIFKNNNFPNVYTLTQTPRKNEKDNYRYVKENYSADQNRIVNIPKLPENSDKSSKKINLSNVYKLPILLRNGINKLNTINKPQKTDLEKETIKQHFKKIASIDISNNKKIYEMKDRINKDINKNVNINIIDYNKICIKKELKPIKILKNIKESNAPIIKKEENLRQTKLHNFMKDKFYADTEIRMNKKLKDIVFNHDRSLKDKIIEMNKIGDFWGGIVDYCNPVFTIKKYGYLKNKLNKNKRKIRNNNNMEEINNPKNLSENKTNIKNEIKSMRLFTINSYFDYKHQKKINSKKEFLEKYNDSLQYYMM